MKHTTKRRFPSGLESLLIEYATGEQEALLRERLDVDELDLAPYRGGFLTSGVLIHSRRAILRAAKTLVFTPQHLGVSPFAHEAYLDARVLGASPVRQSHRVWTEGPGFDQTQLFDYTQFVEPVEQRLLPVVRRSIMMRFTRMSWPVGRNPHFFYLWWNASLGSREIRTPYEILRMSATFMSEGFAPTGLGMPLVDPKNGFVVGELHRHNFYVHFYPQCETRAKTREMVERILDGVVGLLRKRTARPSSMGSKRDSQLREGYVKLCLDREHQGRETDLERLNDSMGLYQKAEKGLVEILRSKGESDAKVQVLARIIDERDQTLSRAYDQITQLPEVCRARVGFADLKILTHPLTATHPVSGEQVEIGVMEITIPFNQSGSTIRWRNKTRQVNSVHPNMQAPYVKEDGSPVFGSWMKNFSELYAHGGEMWPALVKATIRFIQMAGADDPYGRNLLLWPLISSVSRKEQAS